MPMRLLLPPARIKAVTSGGGTDAMPRSYTLRHGLKPADSRT